MKESLTFFGFWSPLGVLLVELDAVLLQVLLDFLDLLLGQQCGGPRRKNGIFQIKEKLVKRKSGYKCDALLIPRPPDKLAELLHGAPLQDLALEVPEPVGVVHLVTPPGHTGHHISS